MKTIVLDAVAVLESATERLAAVTTLDDESQLLLSYAHDGITAALGYLRTLADRYPSWIKPKTESPVCCVCKKPSVRTIQTRHGLSLLCATCEPPAPEAPRKFKLPPLKPRAKTVAPLRAKQTAAFVCSRSGSKQTVKCAVDYTYADNEEGYSQECVVVECGECGHTEQSWGQGERSVRRCLVLMGEHCPEGADNFYILSERDQ